MNLAKKIRLLEKLSAGPQEMPPEAVPVSGPPPGAPAVPAQDEASMPGGDAAGAEEKLTALMETLSSATGDASKFDGGNMRAGVRLRKAALQAAKELKSLRSEVQAVRSGKSEEAAKAKVMQAMEALKSQQQAMPQAPQAPQAPSHDVPSPFTTPQQSVQVDLSPFGTPQSSKQVELSPLGTPQSSV